MKGRTVKTDSRYLLSYYVRRILKYGYGVTHFKLGSLLMHPVPTCCRRIMGIFKQGQYSYRCNAFIQHGRFDLLLEKSWW